MNRSFFKYGIYSGITLSIIFSIVFYQMFLSLPDVNMNKLNLIDLNGNKIDKNILFEKPLVINYWATWCAPCVKELPEFVEISKKYKNQVRFVFISDEKLSVVQKFCQRKKLDLEFINTTDNLNIIGLNVRPSTFFYKKNGVLEKSLVGGLEKADIEEQIKSILEK